MKKLILVVILIFFVSLSTVRVYGYYDDSDTQYLSETETKIKIMESIQTSNGKNLVPTGVILGINDTEEIIYTYKVFIQDGIDFEYYIQNLSINNEIASNDVNDLFNFEFEVKKLEKENIQVDLFNQSLDGRFVEITVILTMNMPSESQFNIVFGQQLSFDFTAQTVPSRALK